MFLVLKYSIFPVNKKVFLSRSVLTAGEEVLFNVHILALHIINLFFSMDSKKSANNWDKS